MNDGCLSWSKRRDEATTCRAFRRCWDPPSSSGAIFGAKRSLEPLSDWARAEQRHETWVKFTHIDAHFDGDGERNDTFLCRWQGGCGYGEGDKSYRTSLVSSPSGNLYSLLYSSWWIKRVRQHKVSTVAEPTDNQIPKEQCIGIVLKHELSASTFKPQRQWVPVQLNAKNLHQQVTTNDVLMCTMRVNWWRHWGGRPWWSYGKVRHLGFTVDTEERIAIDPKQYIGLEFRAIRFLLWWRWWKRACKYRPIRWK